MCENWVNPLTINGYTCESPMVDKGDYIFIISLKYFKKGISMVNFDYKYIRKLLHIDSGRLNSKNKTFALAFLYQPE